MPTIDVVIEKRSDDYKAYLADNEKVWDCGRSEAEALGKLVMSAQSLLALHVSVPKRKRK